MYRRETRVLLRHYLEQGVGKTELARRFGVSRRTIYHWVETGQLDRDLDNEPVTYTARPPVPRKLDPYRGILQERLGAFPDRTAQRLFDEIQAAGYSGGYTQVKEYVRSIRPQPPADPVVRFETPAGFAQAEHWLEQTANARRHRTIGEPPRERFERDERSTLRALATSPYRRLGSNAARSSSKSVVPAVEVQRRPLSVYAEAVR